MDIFAGLALIALLGVFAALVVSPRTAQSLDTFAAGFLPYRSAGWPQGVQEEDSVRWSWSPPRTPDAPDAGSGAGQDPELVEITGVDAPATAAVHRGRTVHGTARRGP